MTELEDFERRLREDLVRSAELHQPPTGAAQRAIDSARARVAPTDLHDRRMRHWTLPLAAAAAALLMVSGVAMLNSTSQGTGQASPSPASSETPRSTSPAPTTASPSPASSKTPRSTSHAPTTAPPPPAIGLTHRVVLGTATLSIPRGWIARTLLPSGGWPTWCLEPSTTPLTSATCLVIFREVPTSWTGQALDPTTAGGWEGNSQYCGVGDASGRQPGLLDYGDRTFGVRPADYRRWQYNCASGTIRVEQYVVATGPGFILFSERAGPKVHDAMATIAQTASVPAESTPLRYADTGIVRSVTHTPAGYQVTLDRVVSPSRPLINDNPATYPYMIPEAIAAKLNPAPSIGDLIFIATDGYRVREAVRY